jgi:hypothetical protein
MKMPNAPRGPRKVWRFTLGFLAAVLAPLGCGDATDVELIDVTGSGVVFGRAYLDVDRDGSPGGGDPPIPGVDVALVTTTSAQVVLLATTDAAGEFALFDAPVGSYLLRLDQATLGDTLEVLGSEAITIVRGDTTRVNLGATYPTFTIEEVLAAPPGQVVFTSGIAVNARLNVDPSGQVHLAGATAFLRALGVERSPISVGDSVRLRGRVVEDNGRPALDGVTATVLVDSVALVVPVATTPGGASNAQGGALDAALVRISNVLVADTATNVLDQSFRFWAVDGADSVEVVVRPFLGYDTSSIQPGSVLSGVTGLLSPIDEGVSSIRWQILPRSREDIVPTP